MSVIEKILELMNKSGTSARKLTMDLGLANSCISEWKKGKARPSLEAVVKIAGYFNVTTDYLLLEKREVTEMEDKNEPNVLKEQELKEKYDTNDLCEPGIAGRRNYREHYSLAEKRKRTDELSIEDKKLLECYYRLDEEDREYIRCKMVVLEREASE